MTLSLRLLNIKREARKNLLKAARLLRIPGRWGRGAYSNGPDYDRCYCVTGALAFVSGCDASTVEGNSDIDNDQGQAANHAFKALKDAVAGELHSWAIHSWNDAQTSAKAVAGALRKAARNLR